MRLILICLLLCIHFVSSSQERERTLIEQGVEAMQAKDHEKSLSLLVEAKTLALQNKNHKELYLAINNIGANYYIMLDYGEALSNYLQAYDIAIEHLTPEEEMSVLNNIAILYSKEGDFSQAENYFRKAYEIADKSNKLKSKGLYAINLGAVLNERNQLLEAREYLEEGKSIYNDDPKMMMEININLANNFMLSGETQKAINYSLSLEPKLIGVENSENKIFNLLVLSKAYQQQNNSDKALFYAEKCLSGDVNLENKIDVYQHLSNLYVSQKKWQEALSAKDTIIKTEGELNEIKNGRLFESNKVKFEVKNYQRELQHQQEKIESQKKQFYFLLSGSILFLIITGWALRNSKIKNKQKKILHEKAQELISLELEKEKTEKLLLEKQLKEKEAVALLQQEKYKNEIEIKNRKLSAKALYLSNRNNLVSDIIKDLEKIYHIRKDAEMKSHLLKLKSLLKAEDEWDSFVKHFEEVNHGLIDNLNQKYSSLNHNDIRFLSYIYMNLSLKEISQIFSITPDACRKRKERVSKKIGLESSSQLYDFLYTIA